MADEPAVLLCPCGRKLRAQGGPGARVRCPRCQSVLIVPGPKPEGEQQPQEPGVSTVPIKGRGSKLGGGDVAMGLLVLAGACALLISGVAVGVPAVLRAVDEEGEGVGILTLGVGAMGIAAAVFGLGILARVEMMRRMYVPAGVLFAIFSGVVTAMTNMAPMYSLLTVFYAGMCVLMWTSAAEGYTGGGFPTWAVSGPIAGVAAVLAIVMGLNAKKAHEAGREARAEEAKFDKKLLNDVRPRVIEAAVDATFTGGAILDLAPGEPDPSRAPGTAQAQEQALINAKKHASESIRDIEALDAQFQRLSDGGARPGWTAGRGLLLRILRVVATRVAANDNSSVGGMRAPLRQAVDRAKDAHGATDKSATPEDLRILKDAITWGEKLLLKTQ